MKTLTNNDKNYYRLKDNIDWVGDKKYNRIVYRTWWMIAVNLLLKILQAFTHDPFLVNVESEMDDEGNPHFIRYCFTRTHLDDRYFERIKSSFLSWRYTERYYTSEYLLNNDFKPNFKTSDLFLSVQPLFALH